ncbi:MAG TPA: hypothetical protein PKC43_06630 [Phycisphaerales bacterium]|nr:hypothetical protein [Phycisphaerales bacterium]HMP37107.1 hypothetical protein [Phycisphaerales bacterium]
MQQKSGVDIPVRVKDETAAGLRAISTRVKASLGELRKSVMMDGLPGGAGGLRGAAGGLTPGMASRAMRGGAAGIVAGLAVGEIKGTVDKLIQLRDRNAEVKMSTYDMVRAYAEAIPVFGRVFSMVTGLGDSLHELATGEEAAARAAARRNREIGAQTAALHESRRVSREIVAGQRMRLDDLAKEAALAQALIGLDEERSQNVRDFYALEARYGDLRKKHAAELQAFDDAKAETRNQLNQLQNQLGFNDRETGEQVHAFDRETERERQLLVGRQGTELGLVEEAAFATQQRRHVEAARQAMEQRKEDEQEAQRNALRQRLDLEHDVWNARRSLTASLLTDEQRQRLRFEEQFADLERRGASRSELDRLRILFAQQGIGAENDYGMIQRVQAQSLGRFQRDRGTLEQREVAPERAAKAAEETAKATKESERLLTELLTEVRNQGQSTVQVVGF